MYSASSCYLILPSSLAVGAPTATVLAALSARAAHILLCVQSEFECDLQDDSPMYITARDNSTHEGNTTQTRVTGAPASDPVCKGAFHTTANGTQ